jgi:hypothetical protein
MKPLRWLPSHDQITESPSGDMRLLLSSSVEVTSWPVSTSTIRWTDDMHAAGPRIWRRRVAVAFSFGLLALGACAPTTVQTQQDYSGTALPRPDRVIVYDFAVSPDEVTLDQGLT